MGQMARQPLPRRIDAVGVRCHRLTKAHSTPCDRLTSCDRLTRPQSSVRRRYDKTTLIGLRQAILRWALLKSAGRRACQTPNIIEMREFDAASAKQRHDRNPRVGNRRLKPGRESAILSLGGPSDKLGSDPSGRGADWLARLLGVQEVAGSNPVVPICI